MATLRSMDWRMENGSSHRLHHIHRWHQGPWCRSSLFIYQALPKSLPRMPQPTSKNAKSENFNHRHSPRFCQDQSHRWQQLSLTTRCQECGYETDVYEGRGFMGHNKEVGFAYMPKVWWKDDTYWRAWVLDLIHQKAWLIFAWATLQAGNLRGLGAQERRGVYLPIRDELGYQGRRVGRKSSKSFPYRGFFPLVSFSYQVFFVYLHSIKYVTQNMEWR